MHEIHSQSVIKTPSFDNNNNKVETALYPALPSHKFSNLTSSKHSAIKIPSFRSLYKMKFFTDFHVASIDGLLGQTQQSILFEIIAWVVIYIVWAQFMSSRLRRSFRNCSFWELAKEHNGLLCGNGQDDTVLFAIQLTHHGAAGALMLMGYVTGDSTLFRHGYLCETGFEVADLIAMVIPLYPYRKYDGMKNDMRIANIFHHVSFFFTIPFF